MHDHKWKYRVEVIKSSAFKKQEEKHQEIEDRLNRWGMEGWELINVVAISGLHPQYYLKRKH